MLNEIGEFKWIQHFVQYRKFRMLDEMLNPFKLVLSSFLQNLDGCFFISMVSEVTIRNSS